MTSSSAHQTDGMLRQRRIQSEAKHRAVRTAIDACVAGGTTDSAAGIARKAAVTETFLYRHEAEPCGLCAQVFGMGPVEYLRTHMARILDSRDAHAQAQGLVTAATMRADLANSRAANHRLQQRLQALERRLGEVLGHAVQDKLPSWAASPSTSTQPVKSASARCPSRQRPFDCCSTNATRNWTPSAVSTPTSHVA